MKQQINAGNIKTLASVTTILSMAIGAVGSYLFHIMYPHANINALFNMGALFLFIHIPFTLTALDSLRHEIGWRSPVKIVKNSFISSKRKIPVSTNGKNTNIFMSSIPWISSSLTETESFTVIIDNIEYTVLLSEMESFIRAAWARQRNGEPGLSRTYWVKQRYPRLKTQEYNARIRILENVPGLILDRGKGRSGRLTASPLLIMEALV